MSPVRRFLTSSWVCMPQSAHRPSRSLSRRSDDESSLRVLRETDADPKPLLLQAAVPSVRPLKYDMLSDAEESAISGSTPSESFLLFRLIDSRVGGS